MNSIHFLLTFLAVPLSHNDEDNVIHGLKLIHSMMILDWTTSAKPDFTFSFRRLISDSEVFQFTPLDVWRIRTELFIFISSLTKMYENDRIENCCEESPSPGVSLRLPDVLNYSFLWAIVVPGDIIEYVPYSDENEEMNSSQFIQRATVTGIRAEMDGTSNTLLLNNGDRLIKSLHKVRRVAGRDLITQTPIYNPLRRWVFLDELLLTPTEDAADDADMPVNINVDNPGKHQPDPKLIARARARDKVERAKRMRNTTNQIYKEQVLQKEHTGHIDNDRKSSFLGWMDPRSIPREINFLNRLYRTCLEIGDTSSFYNLIQSQSAEGYKARKHNLNRDVFEFAKRAGVIAMKIAFAVVFFKSFVNVNGVHECVPGTQSNVESPTTKREVKRIEETLKFEHKNTHLKIQKCTCCMQNHLNEVPSIYDPKDPYKCTSCTNSKISDTFFLDKKLLPVWYELNPGATEWNDFKLDENNQKIVRYDIPRELSVLSSSEQLLIRKVAPYIPSIHLSHGFYALTGQCVAFRQDVADVCTDLPRHPDEIVTFVRQMGNANTTAVHLRDLKVRKREVLAALHWLKLHHRGYRDITISESKLDWLGESGTASVAGIIRNIRVNGKEIPRSQRPAVSRVQCMEISQDSPQVDWTMISVRANEMEVNPEQLELMKELEDTAVTTMQKGQLLNFPKHDDEPIK